MPGLTLEPLEQTYRRTTATTYHYEAPAHAFTAELEVDAAGFVVRYPGFWERESLMPEPPARRFAPEIFRKRMLIEGYFARDALDADAILEYFRVITSRLGLRTYGEPIVHRTSGQGKASNEGFDAFVPLIDSGIYVCVWSSRRFAPSFSIPARNSTYRTPPTRPRHSSSSPHGRRRSSEDAGGGTGGSLGSGMG